MERFIPREKLSKRARKALDGRKRVLWARCPVTRRTENKKAYDRKKDLRLKDETPEILFSERIGVRSPFPCAR